MTCTGCEQRVANVLRRVQGVREVSADHPTGRVEVRVGPTWPTGKCERIEAAGYQVVEGVSR